MTDATATNPAPVDPAQAYADARKRNATAAERARRPQLPASDRLTTLLPPALLAVVIMLASACAGGEDQTACAEPSDSAVLAISNVTGDCALPTKLDLASLAADGCSVAHTATADQCSFRYSVTCEGVTFTVEAYQFAEDDVRGRIHKAGEGCSGDADVQVLPADPWK